MYHPTRLLPTRIVFTDAGDGGGGDGDGSGDGAGDGKQYTPPATQADLDRIISQAVARTHKQYEGHDDLKAKASKWDEHEAGALTADAERQRAIDEAKEAGRTEAQQVFLTRLVHSEARRQATALGFHDPDDALRVIDAEALPVKDEDADTDAIKALLEQLAKDKPHLVATQTRRRQTDRPRERRGERVDADAKPKKGRAAAAMRELRR